MLRRSFLIALTGIALAPYKAIAASPNTVEMFGTCVPAVVKQQVKVVAKAVPTQRYAAVYDIQGVYNPPNAVVAAHLLRDHHINPAGMSRDQMFMAHDAAHGVRVKAPVRAASPPRLIFHSKPSSARNCPNGRCPL